MNPIILFLFGTSWKTSVAGYIQALIAAALAYTATGLPDLNDKQKLSIWVGGLLYAVVVAIKSRWEKDHNVTNAPAPVLPQVVKVATLKANEAIHD